MSAYINQLQTLLTTVREQEASVMETVAVAMADSVGAGGVVHLFGCGHSHILCEELFYRAGGLACVQPIFDTGLMLHEGALRSSELERMVGYGTVLMKNVQIEPGELLFVISTSGRNPVPVEVAQSGKAKGATVVAITSLAYATSQPPRHPSGKRLGDLSDMVIDNHVPVGDAALSLPTLAVPFGPVSTVVGAAILNGIFARAIELLVQAGLVPPLFLSGNIDGADAHNEALVQRYRGRIHTLR